MCVRAAERRYYEKRVPKPRFHLTILLELPGFDFVVNHSKRNKPLKHSKGAKT